MLTIFIVMVLVIALINVFFKVSSEKEKPVIVIGSSFLFVIIATTISLLPLAGYESTPIIEDVVLSPLVDGEELDCYLINSEEYYYTYKTDTVHTLSGTNVSYIEDSSDKNIILRKSIYKPKTNMFTFAFGAEKVEYTFYVPRGTVIK